MERLAWLLDNSIRIPIVGYRIGLDAILGLIPGAGDAVGALLSGYIFFSAMRLGAPASVLGRMGLNILLELAVGIVPVFGDVFDAAFKANARNMQLFNDWLDAPEKSRQRSRLLLGGLGGGMGLLALVAAAAGIALLVFLIRALLRMV